MCTDKTTKHPQDKQGANVVLHATTGMTQDTWSTVQQRLEDMAETLNVIYVVNDREQLIDDLRITELIIAAENQTISKLMDESYTALRAFEDQEEAVKMLAKYDRVALPVVQLPLCQ